MPKSIFFFRLKSTGQVTVRYVGNMGILISDKEQSVLVDGLHDFYGDTCEFPPKDLVNSLIANKEEDFPEIVGNLNTHQHGDHVDENITSRFLENNPGVRSIGPDQTCAQISHQAKTCISEGDGQTVFLDEIEAESFYMDHASPARLGSIQNIGFLVKINNRTILHAGDTYFNPKLFERLDLTSQKIDVAILPGWMDDSGKVRDWINPKNILVTHRGPKKGDGIKKQVRSSCPNAIFFTSIREEFDY